MKRIYTLLLSVFTLFTATAQTPQGINYQGVARNASGVELTNQPIGIELSVVDGSVSGSVVYTETHALTTDAHGLFSLVIGNGTPTTGTFAAINWATGGSKWLKVSMDITGGTSYQLMGASQLLSVPYALYAGNVTNNGGKQTLVLSDDVTDAQATAIIAAEVGPNTQEIKIVGTTNLTTVDLSMITTAIYIEVSENAALTTVNLGGLTRCDGSLLFRNCPLLSNINISSLTKITAGNVEFVNTGLTSLSLPALVKCSGDLTISHNTVMTSVNIPGVPLLNDLYMENNAGTGSVTFSSLSSIRSDLTIQNNSFSTLLMPALTSAGSVTLSSNAIVAYSFPALTHVTGEFIGNNPNLVSVSLPALLTCSNNLSVQGNASLSTISIPALTSTGFFGISNNSMLASIDLSSLATISGITMTTNPSLSSLAFPSLTTVGNNNITISNSGITSLSIPALTTFGSNFSVGGNKLTVASVNAVLNRLVSISPSLSGKSINLQFQTPAAAPTGQGLTDKATLTTNGNTVYTD